MALPFLTKRNLSYRHHILPVKRVFAFLRLAIVSNSQVRFSFHRVIVILNSLHLTLTCLSIVNAIDGFSEVTTFTDPLTATLTWRFLLALQSADQRAVKQGSLSAASAGHDDAENGVGSLRFASRVLGSAGASLRAGPGASLFNVEARDEEYEGGHADEEAGRAPSDGCDETQAVSV